MKLFSHLEPHTHPLFFLLLTFIGGFVDSSSFVIFGVFTGHLTGNSVLSMIYISQMNWNMLFISIVSICGVFLGTLSGSYIRTKTASLLAYSLIISFEFILFAIVFSLYFFLPAFYSMNIAVFLISLSMGLQNGFFNKVGSVSIHSTYITGMTTSWIGTIIKRNENGDIQRITLFLFIISFIIGALAGGFLSVNYHFLGFSSVIALLLIALIYSLLINKKRSL
ncbi:MULTISPECIES: YoaK family protein [Providencia]|uniref:YoaK family protein n=1 Tax=Providencia TaxID=586 RepID=UPI0024816F67|nr:YoaK family protein [Providencia rettgeri]EMA4783894.1 DUF1275 domain-containing protein [Providencia rettgeri]EMB3082784.1 DUF1275 domain-containing protein [Providencia rettgeri]MDU7495871.1 YoaK family protein [Providencia rettgeri]HEM8141563.1 DUF1275 domain-containing protein [Providencia rettgeri]HEM8307917.1 DUF1275 domain-containing protein [Providencia rettgeri]